MALFFSVRLLFFCLFVATTPHQNLSEPTRTQSASSLGLLVSLVPSVTNRFDKKDKRTITTNRRRCRLTKFFVFVCLSVCLFVSSSVCLPTTTLYLLLIYYYSVQRSIVQKHSQIERLNIEHLPCSLVTMVRDFSRSLGLLVSSVSNRFDKNDKQTITTKRYPPTVILSETKDLLRDDTLRTLLATWLSLVGFEEILR